MRPRSNNTFAMLAAAALSGQIYATATYGGGRGRGPTKPGKGKRRYWKRKYVRRRSGYFMHKEAGR